jgi:hypothetical protein
MKDLFPVYYPLTPLEFESLWRDGRFVVDANVILNLYRHSPETRDALLAIFERLKEQLWIPYQFALEFHRNREKVILSQVAAYQKVEETFRGTIGQFSGKKHPFASAESQGALDAVCGELAKRRAEVRGLLTNDPYLPKVATLLTGRVGECPAPAMLEERRIEAAKRFAAKIPPGYEDQKEKDDPYGDYLAWAEILDWAATAGKPVVLVTDDAKEDWWRAAHGQTLGPRVELIQELRSRCNVLFHMYSTESFMVHAKGLGWAVKEEAIEELANLREAQIKEAADQRIKDLKPVLQYAEELDQSALLKGLPVVNVVQPVETIEPAKPAPTKPAHRSSGAGFDEPPEHADAPESSKARS